MKNLKFLFLPFVGLIMAVNLGSCNKDDEPGSENAGNGIINVDGARLTGINGYGEIQYDSEGRVKSASDGYESMEFNYSNGQFVWEDETGNFKFNNQGYITELSASWNESGDGYSYKGSGVAKFSYDSAGHIVKFSITSSEIEKEDGETYTYEESSNITYIWKEGNLISSSEKYVSKEDGETENYYTDTAITYSSEINKFQQFPYGLAEVLLMDGPTSLLAAAGVFGKGMQNFPKSILIDEDGYSWKENYNYDLNSNGSINREEADGIFFTYQYTPFDTSSVINFYGNEKRKGLRSLFIRNETKK